MTQADEERAAMDRCYEVDIEDRVEIGTHDERTVQGEVTSMLWRGGIGFRQPDAPEVKWPWTSVHSSTGELQMGAIEMWEQRRRVGARKAGESEEAQPVDVPAKSNETDASSREGRASARNIHVPGGAEDKEGCAPEAQQDVAGPQEGTKRSTRTQLSDTEVEGDGARLYVRMYICT